MVVIVFQYSSSSCCWRCLFSEDGQTRCMHHYIFRRWRQQYGMETIYSCLLIFINQSNISYSTMLSISINSFCVIYSHIAIILSFLWFYLNSVNFVTFTLFLKMLVFVTFSRVQIVHATTLIFTKFILNILLWEWNI